MYIIDNVAYAGEPPAMINVKSVNALADYELLVTFTNGERRRFDFKPLLDLPVFKPLKDENLFKSVYIDYGTAVWGNDIDIAPETLLEYGFPV
ncbi:MAG: DUF2442 domain-containing protein [Oscillospiraceae bacterium]|nr:DUF2442 domain-containing protein [Oscillospiraceae bacterium]